MPKNAAASTNSSSQIRIYMLGHFRIERDAKHVQLPTRKVESLLAYLILNSESHAREKLAALFWGDSPDTEARNSLRNALAVLNKKLGHDLFIIDRQRVQVNPEYPLWVDAVEFEAQASEFLVDPVSKLNQVNIELYQNDLLIDFYDDWIFPQREHYHSLFLESLLQLTQQLRSQSEYKKAIGFAEKVLSLDQTNERAHQHLIFCYLALGDRSAALRQYVKCQRVLEDELGVAPSTATTALNEWIKQTPLEANPLEARITNLPIPLTSFIGRKSEMAQVKQLLSSTRLFTLTGPGGSGKTRLAIQTGTELLDAFNDGVWWVDLSALTDESFVIQAISKSLGVQEVADQPLVETISNFLKPRQVLLILDNCEHLLGACIQLVERLLESCPDLKIMTTSREALNMPGEQIWIVPTMTLPDLQQATPDNLFIEYEGIQLFVERAKTVSPDFVLTDENASFAAQICIRLDGIPLAIELAAARIKLLTPEQISVRLNDRFQLLTGGSRTVLPRHQTLRAVMDWSYNLLNEKERILFQRSVVFSGGWNLEAAEAVCSGSQIEQVEVLDLLSSLVDKSLVIRDGEQDGRARYRMLETIRQYAREVSQNSGEEQSVQEQHLEYFSGMVKSVNPHLGFFLPDREMLSWLNILVSELANVRSALNFCKTNLQHAESGLEMAANLHWFWLLNNQFTEGRDWINTIIMESKTISEPVLALAHLSAGFLSCWGGDFSSARPRLEKSLNIFESMDNKSGVAFSLHGLGFAANGLGEPAEAGPLFEKCLKTAKEINDAWLVSFALHFIAIGSSFQGKHELARSQFEECIKIMKNGFGNLQGIAFSHFHLGRLARLNGDYESAYTHHAEGLQIFQQIGDRRGLGYSIFGFACLTLVQEEPHRAARLFGVVDSIREDLGTLLEAILQVEYEHTKSTIQDILGREAFDTAWSEGHKMTMEEAIQYILTSD